MPKIPFPLVYWPGEKNALEKEEEEKFFLDPGWIRTRNLWMRSPTKLVTSICPHARRFGSIFF